MDEHVNGPDCGAIVIIRFPADQYQRCKNGLIKNLPIHSNYSDGEVEGIANYDKITKLEGYWPGDKGLAFLAFESYPAADRWTYSVPDIKQPDWLGGIDMILVPCCEHSKIRHSVIQILDLDIRDFDSLNQAYSPEASEILKQHDARQVVSTDVLKFGKKVRGQWDPGYLIINTWESEDCFHQAYYGEKNQSLIQKRLAAATSNSCVCVIEPLIQRHY